MLEQKTRDLPSAHPLLTFADKVVTAENLLASLENVQFPEIKKGSIVAIEGKFDPLSIAMLIYFIDRKCVIVPVSNETRSQHDYFYDVAGVEYIVRYGELTKRNSVAPPNHKINSLIKEEASGLIVFTSGTTGKPKAILHNLDVLLQKFNSRGKKLKTLAFLLFDHMGGFNTFCHALISGSEIVCPDAHDPETIFRTVSDHKVELLPASPSFLRAAINTIDLSSFDLTNLKLITYGSELMDEKTLLRLCQLLPGVEFRQTYGLSELGVFPVKTKSKKELWIQIGSDGVSTRIINDRLHIKSKWRMIGYLNADDPFDSEGYFDTKDIVKVENEWIQIVGRESDIINVGGKKISSGELEKIFGQLDYIADVEVYRAENPITGNHIEANIVFFKKNVRSKKEVMKDLAQIIPEDFMPARIKFVEKINLSHRFKRTGNIKK